MSVGDSRDVFALVKDAMADAGYVLVGLRTNGNLGG